MNSSFAKIKEVVKVLKNWYLLPCDKFGIKRELTYTTRDGYMVLCRTRSTDINEAVVIFCDHEYPSQFLHLEDNDICLDLGANIGAFTLYLNKVNPNARYRGAAIEPFAENFELLKRNLERNRLSSMRPVQCAIGDIDGTVDLDTNCPVDSVKVAGGATGIKVQSRRLSTFCQEQHFQIISLLKVDIEGSEYDMIRSDLPFLIESGIVCKLRSGC